MRNALYLNIVCAFCIAGLLDLRAGETKLGVLAIGFGVLNGIIFFWRP